MKLLNPGPVTLSSRVRQALLRPDLCHREPEFSQLQHDLRSRLLGVYPQAHNDYASVLLTGSGTAAVEAMLASLTPWQDRPTLVVANGVYGQRMATMLQRQGKPHLLLSQDWLEALDLGAVEQALSQGGWGALATVHHETTTGRLNDLPALGQLCQRYQVPLLLDAVSSFGGEFIDFQGWNLLACAATANKCLHGVPGLSFVVGQTSALAQADRSPCLYLNLADGFRLQEQGSTPFTPAVHCCYALQEALIEMEEQGGWSARAQLYSQRMLQLRQGLETLGLEPLLASGHSQILCSYRLPQGLSYAQLHDALKAEGLVIYAGQGHLAHSILRLAIMGELDSEDLSRVCSIIGRQLSTPWAARN